MTPSIQVGNKENTFTHLFTIHEYDRILRFYVLQRTDYNQFKQFVEEMLTPKW